MTGYLGPDGTFTKSAAVSYNGGTEGLREYKTIYSLLCAVNDGKIERAVLPIENSVEGVVNITIDTLAFDTNVYITDSFVHKIHQNLLARPDTALEDITVVYSKDQAIGQCSRMISKQLAGVSIEFTESTAAAARLVSESGEPFACIASAETAELYGLNILIPDCSDRTNNCTRFIVVEKEPPKAFSDNDISSIMLMLENKTGSLYGAIELFNKHRINMVMIMSRPSKEKLGEYVFFIDFEGNLQSENVQLLLSELKEHTSVCKYLGSYAAH